MLMCLAISDMQIDRHTDRRAELRQLPYVYCVARLKVESAETDVDDDGPTRNCELKATLTC